MGSENWIQFCLRTGHMESLCKLLHKGDRCLCNYIYSVLQMLLYTPCNTESNNIKHRDTPERSDTLTEEKETVEREGAKASLH